MQMPWEELLNRPLYMGGQPTSITLESKANESPYRVPDLPYQEAARARSSDPDVGENSRAERDSRGLHASQCDAHHGRRLRERRRERLASRHLEVAGGAGSAEARLRAPPHGGGQRRCSL